MSSSSWEDLSTSSGDARPAGRRTNSGGRSGATSYDDDPSNYSSPSGPASMSFYEEAPWFSGSSSGEWFFENPFGFASFSRFDAGSTNTLEAAWAKHVKGGGKKKGKDKKKDKKKGKKKGKGGAGDDLIAITTAGGFDIEVDLESRTQRSVRNGITRPVLRLRAGGSAIATRNGPPRRRAGAGAGRGGGAPPIGAWQRVPKPRPVQTGPLPPKFHTDLKGKAHWQWEDPAHSLRFVNYTDKQSKAIEKAYKKAVKAFEKEKKKVDKAAKKKQKKAKAGKKKNKNGSDDVTLPPTGAIGTADVKTTAGVYVVDFGHMEQVDKATKSHHRKVRRRAGNASSASSSGSLNSAVVAQASKPIGFYSGEDSSVWQWNDPIGSDNYRDYEAKTSDKIDKAYRKWAADKAKAAKSKKKKKGKDNDTKLQITTPAGKYKISFVTLEQRSLDNSRVRTIRRLSKAAAAQNRIANPSRGHDSPSTSYVYSS